MCVCADNKLNFAKMMISVFHEIENILRRGENAVIQALSFFSKILTNSFLFAVFNPFPSNRF